MNRRKLMLSVVFAAALLVAQVGAQQAPAGAPAGTTGLCNDGTYYSGASKKGACRGHKGVKEWYGASANTEKGSASAGTSQTTPAPAAKQAPEQSAPAATSTTTKAQAPGGGAGMVWVNTSSNVYHCQGSRYYGKTKTGTYMTESEARAKGARPDHGKPCQ